MGHSQYGILPFCSTHMSTSPQQFWFELKMVRTGLGPFPSGSASIYITISDA